METCDGEQRHPDGRISLSEEKTGARRRKRKAAPNDACGRDPEFEYPAFEQVLPLFDFYGVSNL
jgi:hypothetical protein